MKAKTVLRFYFSVDRLNTALDNLILAAACRVEGGTDGIIDLIEKKCELSYLWEYVDGIVASFDLEERATLEFYGCLRVGLDMLEPARGREVKRVVTKFARRARNISRFEKQMEILKSFWCLM